MTGNSGAAVLALARYLPDGSPDPSFGSGGAVVSPFPGAAYALALQPDGKIVVGGTDYTFTSFALARFQPDGAVDTGFGSGGEVTTRLDPIWGSLVTSLAVQADGKIVAAGLVAAGETTWPAVALQGDGKIVLAGASPSHFALARYGSTGRLDRSFGSRGTVTSAFGTRSAAAGGLVVQRDGKLVAAGAVSDQVGAPRGFALARYVASFTCRVPDVRRRPLAAAERAIVRAHCSVGRVTRAFSATVRKGRVVSQRPAPGAQRPEHAKVRLVVSAGSRRL